MATWTLYSRCSQFGHLPSTVFGLQGEPWLSWCFDNAVYLFGNWVENNRFEYDEKGRKTDHIHELLRVPKAKPVNQAAQLMQHVPGRKIIRVAQWKP